MKIDRFVKKSQCKQHCSDSVIKGASFTPSNSSTLSFLMFQSNHVLHYMWNVEFSPIKDGDRSRQGRGGGEVQDQGFHLKVSVNPIVCLEKVIFSVG